MLNLTRRAGNRALPIIGLFLLVVAIGGCTHVRELVTDQKNRSGYFNGPNIDIESEDLVKYASEQDKVIERLVQLTGKPAPTGNWKPIVNAGMVYVDRQCERYIDAIFWFNRYKKATSNEVALVGAATAGIMGILDAAAKEIAATAVIFGLATATVDNVGALFYTNWNHPRYDGCSLSPSKLTGARYVKQSLPIDPLRLLQSNLTFHCVCLRPLRPR